MNKKEKQEEKIRLWILAGCFLAAGAILTGRLYCLQILEGEAYADGFTQKITKVVKEKGIRGTIYDSKGKPLAQNRLVYTLTMTNGGMQEKNQTGKEGLNERILRIYRVLQENRETLTHDLKLRLTPDGMCEYTVEGAALRRFQADVFGKADPETLTEAEKRMSAEAMLDWLAEKYGCEDLDSREEKLAVAGVRYQLSLHAYRQYVPVTLADHIGEKTVAWVMENQASLPGVDVEENWERVYPGGEAFAHILGYTGIISAQELEAFAATEEENDYTPDSIVGKSGMEQYLEQTLRGRDGERSVVVNHVGRIVEEGEVLRSPQAGNDVYLSIDSALQQKVYDLLERKIADILLQNLIPEHSFDRTKVRDASQIRIPVTDVYVAIVKNGILSLPMLRSEYASEAERRAAAWLEETAAEAREQLEKELLTGTGPVGELSEEIKAYGHFLVKKWCPDPDRGDESYQKWEKEALSLRSFFLEALKKGWAEIPLSAKGKYLTAEEYYREAVKVMVEDLAGNAEFEKLVWEEGIRNGEISGACLLELLYEQGVFSRDGSEEKLKNGTISAYELVRQKIDSLEIRPWQLGLDPCSASAVVVSVQNGKVLACVSYPGYDNNRLANRMDTGYYNQIYQSPALPFYHRATQQLSAPGSTFKPVAVAAGMEEGVIRADTSVVCDGVFDKVTPALKCWKHSGHGEVADAAAALQHSCNDYLCEISWRLGGKETGVYQDAEALGVLQKYAVQFGLDRKSGVELPESEPQVTDRFAIPSAIGQGTHNYATVQLARYGGVLATRGKVFSLSLLQSVGEAGKQKEEASVLLSRTKLEDATWDAIQAGMEQFAANNAVLRETGLPVAGKTGTAQESRTRPDHSLFVGYAPAEEAEISVAVRIVNGYGSSHATSVGRDIFRYYFGIEENEKGE